MTEQITLYSAKVCPWAHRAELALKESGLDYTRYEINLQNKPKWFAPQVNPVSKVPALTYGGPKVSPDAPSPESIKLAESYVLLEFIADISGKLLPKDHIGRAKARFFIETTAAKFPSAWTAVAARGEDPASILPVIEVIQNLLPKEGGFAVGEYSIADAAITPFLARATVALKNDLGAYDAGQGKVVYETLQTDPKYVRFKKYYEDVSSKENFKQTFFEDYITEVFRKRWGEARAQRLAAKSQA